MRRAFTASFSSSASRFPSAQFLASCGLSNSPVTDLEDLPTEPPGEIVAIDFFTVSTVRMRVLFVFIVLELQRRKVLHFGVTEHPTSEWVGQQVVEAFAEREAPRYLIRDRDASYDHEFRRRIQSLGVKEVITAPRSPWQNAFAERLIGSIRRECLDHVVGFA